MTLLLRVVVSSKHARRIQLPEVPGSVAQLIDELKEKLQLEDIGHCVSPKDSSTERPAHFCPGRHNQVSSGVFGH
ncbi:hypothetical protein PBY51_019487 [Eleginops maclovinus]|uniref:Uncharacterized protein n=1 Tax=Eleginops maclovinus TaxID=56733 RepID=A0AAN7YBC4_ELEMC|nr:hypothetical protein PBY51_007262 [Eleginops maclovinus]KAK5864739.1 hypothetical protein PBY51_015957 [Eleginops maclovinus]KAK5874551.1 hypothetical protein PBY51_019487 [Eleginops maclovinus]